MPSMSEPHKPTEQERQDAIKILAEKYHITNLNKVNRDGETPLMSAAWDEENLDVMRLLITAGADVNMVDELGESALSTACNEGNTEAAKLLVGAGADVNVANDEGHTSLMSAAMWSDAELVEILLKAGANLDAADDEGYTALDWAKDARAAECVRILRAAGCKSHQKESPLLIAAMEKDAEAVKRLLSEAKKPSKEDIHKAAACACSEGAKDIFALLVPHIGRGRIRTMLLDDAAAAGDADILKMMLKLGTEPNGMDAVKAKSSEKEPWFAEEVTESVSPLINAVVAGCPECVRLLLEYGAVPDLESDNGTTPLALAEDLGQEECAELIREALKK